MGNLKLELVVGANSESYKPVNICLSNDPVQRRQTTLNSNQDSQTARCNAACYTAVDLESVILRCFFIGTDLSSSGNPTDS